MEENNINQQKPLRRTSNKIKDIYDAYVKNDKTKNIPISDDDQEFVNDDHSGIPIPIGSQVMGPDISMNETVILEMHSRIEDLNSSMLEAQSLIESLKKENTELKELSLRKTAELENFRKRSIREKSDLVDYANEKLLSNFVEILDDLNSALTASQNSNDLESLKKGIELIYNKTKKLFDEAGVSSMEFNDDTEFDVHYHEALMMSPSDKPEGTVIQVLQNGYMMKDKVLRHAKVITSSGN